MDDGLQTIQAAESEDSNQNDHLIASFGIVGNELYDPSRHEGESIERHPVDGRQYATDQIDWIITERQTVPEASVQYRMGWLLYSENLDRPCKTPVVTSDLPLSKLPLSLKHGGVRILFNVEFKPGPKAMEGISRLKNSLLYPRKPKFVVFKYYLHFKIDPVTGRLSVTAFYLDGTAVSGSRTVWKDPENLNDGCSAISIPPPMYCLTRPESTAASLFERIAEQRARRENRGQGEDDTISADESTLGDPNGDVGS